MAKFVRKLNDLLREKFPAPDLIELEDDKGIIGTIISTRFKNMEMMDRVNLIWDFLDENLTKEERRKIVLIIAMTPKERLLHSSA